MEYYSTTKKNEIMTFATTWTGLKIIILSEVSQTVRQISYDIAYMWSQKIYTNELFTKQKYTQRTNLWLPGGRGGSWK